MRVCKHCSVRIELHRKDYAESWWLHRLAHGCGPDTFYLECKLPPVVAEPEFA